MVKRIKRALGKCRGLVFVASNRDQKTVLKPIQTDIIIIKFEPAGRPQ